MQVLLVEDDHGKAANELAEVLVRRGERVYRIWSDRLSLAAVRQADFVLIHASGPRNGGAATCRQIRSISAVPIIIVADGPGTRDRVLGLRSGADDYLVAPYDAEELIIRMRTVGRRRRGGDMTSPTAIRIGDIYIDVERMTVSVAGRSVGLTKREFQVLAIIASEGGKVCGSHQLAVEVWGRSEAEVSESLHVLISRLRGKLGHERIKTIRTVGYRLAEPGEPVSRTAAKGKRSDHQPIDSLARRTNTPAEIDKGALSAR